MQGVAERLQNRTACDEIVDEALANARPGIRLRRLAGAVRVLKAGAGRLHDQGKRSRGVGESHPQDSGRGTIRKSRAGRKAGLGRDKGSHAHAARDALRPRVYEVMSRIASGKTVTEIAEELSLSAKTISTYRARVLEKLGVKNSAEIVQYAIRNGLVI
jgi:two-component system, NarL family, invasion response regulator UvrY